MLQEAGPAAAATNEEVWSDGDVVEIIGQQVDIVTMAASLIPKPLQELVQDGSLCVVPETHIVPPEERARPERSDNDYVAPDLPLIDMEGVDGERRGVVLRQIQKACEDWGFFQVQNHGVPLSLLKRMQEAAAGFFDRPWEEKMSYRLKDEEDTIKSQGYGSKDSPKQGLPSNWGDQLQHEVFPLSARNYDLWPTNPSSFRETEEEFLQEQRRLSNRILELISESLGLKRSFMEDHFEYKQVLIVNFYPPCPEPDLAMGLQKHSDFGLLTLLLQDTIPGLQVRKDGKWITVKPVEGAIVVNVGDQVQILTNGRYKSVEHRALVNSSKKRMSIVFFTNLNDDSVVAPVSDLMDSVTPPRYNQCAFGAYKTAAFAILGDSGKRLIERMEIN